MLLNLGEIEGARKNLNKSLELAPKGVTWPRENLAALELNVGNFQTALAIFDQLPQMIVDPLVASNIGTAHFYLEQYEDAATFYRLATRLRPMDHVLHRNLADALVELGRPNQASQEFQVAFELATDQLLQRPGDEGLRTRAVLYLAKAGDCKQALPMAHQLEATVTRTQGAFHRLAQSFAICGDSESALRTVAISIELGRPTESIALDHEFDVLSDDEEFQRLTTKVPPDGNR